mmetsp:Transcript_26485/g.81451  ORF Transcript_26485/g.81451 Transcript_26485/m.81451 type:complete len:307 (+) Transcript_26485:70-990(+)
MYLRQDSRLEPPAKHHRGAVLKRAASSLGEEERATREGKSKYWENLWSSGVRPGTGFDSGSSCKALAYFLKEEPLGQEIARRGGDALVPGCGRGYDCELVKSCGPFQKVLGLELSQSAAKAAQKWLQEVSSTEGIEVKAQNFFEVSCKAPGTYDLIFDCSFLTALHPHARPGWAKKMKKLVKPGGYLVLVVFPLAATGFSLGQFLRHRVLGAPPYPLASAQVTDLLVGFDQVYSNDPLPPALAHRRDTGHASSLLVFQKKRLQAIRTPSGRTVLSGADATSSPENTTETTPPSGDAQTPPPDAPAE